MTGRALPHLAVVLVIATVLAGCDTGDGTTLRDPVAPTTQPPIDTTPVSSVAIDDPSLSGSPAGELPFETSGFRAFAPWAEGAAIDLRYTCDGANASPPIAWSEMPEGTAEIAISLVDTSNLSNGRPFIHWVITGLDPSTGRIEESDVPAGAVQGLNFFGDVGYTGPCPDPGSTNTFSLTVFALNQQLELADGTPAAELLDLIATVALDTASSDGTVSR